MEYILLDKFTVWLALICFFALLIGFCIIGNAWIKAQRECDVQRELYKKERSMYNRLVYMYQRDTFKMPEENKDG